jgi:hypothetical protein
MEILNGRIKKVCVCFSGRGKKQTVDMGSSNSYRGAWYYWLIPLCFLSLAGCETMKSSLITGVATSTAVGVTSVVAPGVLVPAVIGGTTAVIASALTAERSAKGEPVTVTADTVVQEAPDNFWTLLGKLTKVGGWALLLIVIVPMVFSWLMPGPIQFKGKKKNGS